MRFFRNGQIKWQFMWVPLGPPVIPLQATHETQPVCQCPGLRPRPRPGPKEDFGLEEATKARNSWSFKMTSTQFFAKIPRLAFPFALNPRPLASSTMSWSCKKCTFLNSSPGSPRCKICLSPSSPPSSPPPNPPPQWSCKACTFLNTPKNTECEICGTRSQSWSLSGLDDLKDTSLEELDSSVGSVFLPLRPCGKRKMKDPVAMGVDSDDIGGFRGIKASNNSVEVKDDIGMGASLPGLKILSYNVWFNEDLEVHKRMKAIGDLIQHHSPNILCFQEVTPNIYDIFCQSSWWKGYQCSVSKDIAGSRPYFCMLLSKLPVKSFSRRPFRNSIMGRELCITELEVQGDKTLVVATSHLESPCPAPPTWNQMYSKERVEQANEATEFLKNKRNVIFGGDMNWDDKLDGPFPLPDGWTDPWMELKPRESGWTYDTKSNEMLSGNRTLQKRLDRFACNLRDFKISGIEMIGKEAIPALSYAKEKKVRKETKVLELPVLPSDHYGLLLTVSSR